MGSFGITKSNITGRLEKEKEKKKTPTEYAPNITASGEAAQNFVSTTTIILGVDREVWSA